MSLVVSFIAILFSAFVFAYNRRASKRDLMLRIYDYLIVAERQHGRRILFEMVENHRRPADLTSEEFLAANHAVATLDLMAFLHKRRYVPRRDAVELWGVTTARTYRAARDTGFLAFRDSQHGREIWPYFRAFGQMAEARFDLGEPDGPDGIVDPSA
jgi:hypothetical protein